jgi:hypothetical protein
VPKERLHQTPDHPFSRILTAGEARELVSRGWAAADLHVHTHHSHDVIPTGFVDPLALYRKARRLGMTSVVFTDHDSMDAYDQIGWGREGLVPAVEVKILDPKNAGHAIVGRRVQATPGTPGVLDTLLKAALETLSRSGIPGSLYLRSQRNLADQIGEFMSKAANAA